MTSPPGPSRRDLARAQSHVVAAAAALGLELSRHGIDKDESSPVHEVHVSLALAFDELGVLLDADGV